MTESRRKKILRLSATRQDMVHKEEENEEITVIVYI